MRRREFIAGLGSMAAWPLAAHAQPIDRVRRVGVLMSVDENHPEGKAWFSGFTRDLAELGWTNGRNLRIEVRWGGGNMNQTRILARELVALQPDAILSQGTPATAALHQETRTIPIIFVVVADPVGDGFVEGLSHPGGNITGFSTAEAGITGKMLEFLMEIAPRIRRVMMIFNPDTAPGGGTYYFRDFEAAAQSFKVEPISAPTRNDAEIENFVSLLAGAPLDGLVITPDWFIYNHIERIIALAARNNVPTIHPWRSIVNTNKGLASYGPDIGDIFRRGVTYVDRILRGAQPGELPVQLPVKFEMAVNLRIAKVLGLTVPQSILLRADEVIE